MEDQDPGEGHDIGLITAIHLVQIAHLLSSLLLYYSHLHAALDETICQSRGTVLCSIGVRICVSASVLTSTPV